MITSRSNQIILPFVFWDPANAEEKREPKGIYEMRSYKLQVRVLCCLIPKPSQLSYLGSGSGNEAGLEYNTLAGAENGLIMCSVSLCSLELWSSGGKIGELSMLSSNTTDSTVVYCGILNLLCCIPTLCNGYSCFLFKGQVQPSDWLNLSHDLLLLCLREQGIKYRKEESIGGWFSQIGELHQVFHLWGELL